MKKVKVRVVRIKGKELLLEVLKGLLSEFEYKITYDDVEGEEDVLYRYEELHVTGRLDSVYVAVTCASTECRVESPIYRFLVEPCYSKPTPAEIEKCIRAVAGSTRKVEERVRELHSMAQELTEHGFEIHKTLTGAEAYWSSTSGGAKSYIRVHLSPRTSSILQLQVEAEPAKIVGIARTLTKLVR